MKLEYKSKVTYNKIKTLDKHPNADCYELSFFANDNAKIYADLFIPKTEIKAVVVEVADFKAPPKDYLNLSRYVIHNYAVCSLHVRGQIGKSRNNQVWSIYAPFLDSKYFLSLYQDTLDILTILAEEFPNKNIYGFGIGQGAASLVVASSISKKIAKLYLANIDNCDFNTIITDDKDSGYYGPIRDYLRYNVDKEEYVKKELAAIDILNYAKEVNAKVYYGQSALNPVTPLACQNKFLALIKDKEIKYYRKFEKESLQEHFFDEYILKILSKE